MQPVTPQPSQNPRGMRPIDTVVESHSSLLNKNLFLVGGKQVAVWHALVATMFIAGFAVAAVWTASTGQFEKTLADTPPGPAALQSTALLAYQDAKGNPLPPLASNTIRIDIVPPTLPSSAPVPPPPEPLPPPAPPQFLSCEGGILSGNCASIQPQYCENGVLTNRASICGCPAGQVAEGERCIIPSPAPAATPTLTNLLIDPGFESSATFWHKTTFGGRSIVATQYHSGLRSQQMAAHTTYPREVYQDVTVDAGATYTISGWIKTDRIGGQGSSLSLVWMNEAITSDSIPERNLVRTDMAGKLADSKDWTRMNASFTAPAQAKVVRVRLLTSTDPDGAGTAWFDDLAFSPAVR